MRRYAPFCLLLLLGSLAHAGSVEVDVSSDTARAAVGWNMLAGRLEAQAGWQHHEDDGDAGHFGVQVGGDIGSGTDPVRGAVGARAFWVDADHGEGAALGIGGSLRVPLSGVPRLELGVEAFFAPGSLTAGDLDDYFEVAAVAAFRMLDNADVHVGYRLVEADFEVGPEVNLADTLFVGIRIEF